VIETLNICSEFSTFVSEGNDYVLSLRGIIMQNILELLKLTRMSSPHCRIAVKSELSCVTADERPLRNLAEELRNVCLIDRCRVES
jgi:hypothetical protein